MEKPIKVKDRSQPIKIFLMVLFLLGATIFGLEIINRLDMIIEILNEGN